MTVRLVLDEVDYLVHFVRVIFLSGAADVTRTAGARFMVLLTLSIAMRDVASGRKHERRTLSEISGLIGAD